MKKFLLLSLLITMYTGMSYSQTGDDNPLNIQFQVLDKEGDDVKLLPQKEVNMLVTYGDDLNSERYKELFNLTTDELSTIYCPVGHGTNPFPLVLTTEMLSTFTIVNWSGTVNTGTELIDISGSQKFTPVPSAINAYQAENALNADRFGGLIYDHNPITFEDVITDDPNIPRDLMISSGSPLNSFNPFSLDQVVFKQPTIYKAGNRPGHLIRLNNGFGNAFALADSDIPETDAMLTVCGGHLQNNYYSVVNFTAKKELSPHALHNTSAIYANNESTEGSAGVNAKAGTWALYGSAPNGSLGVSSGGSNGAGSWGALAQAPDAGGFKYAVLGNSGGFAGAWAGAFFGSGFYTGTWAVSSDARLKTEIRSQANALDKVMQLRPADYNYRQDTPWNLPQGLHHGFIAQEMEEVLPELVSDITMPNSLDTQDMHKSGTSQYKAINYIEMISILTQAMQELNTTLNAKIDNQAKEIETLKKEVNALTGKK